MDYIMFEKKQVPTELLQCSICKGSLSSAPICVLSDGSNICSQCSTSSDNAGYRNFALELVLSDVTFPCIFNKQGCSARPLFGKVIEHQQECRYCPIACASLPMTACTWSGPKIEIPDHFTQQHSDLVKDKIIFQLEINKNIDGVLMVVENGFPFLIKYCYETNTRNLYYSVAYFKLDAVIEDSCKIKLINVSNPDFTSSLVAAKCVLYNDDFFLGSSKAVVCLEKFLENLNNPLNIEVELIFPKYTYQNKLALVVDYEFLESKKCNQCHDYLIPPIFVYEGNDICYDCSYSCAGCKPNDDEELCNILTNQNYPCRWHGCEHIAKGDAISTHVSKCKYRIYLCSTHCCAMFTLSKMIDHLQQLQYTHFVHEFTHILILDEKIPENSAFTIVENELLVIKYSTTYREYYGYYANYKLHTSNVHLDRYTVQVRIEHDHCKRVSKVFSFNRTLSFKKPELPKCFSLGKEMSVTIKVS